MFAPGRDAALGLTDRIGSLRPDLDQHTRRYHVTVARECDDALFAHVAAELEPHLPLVDCVTAAELVERGCGGTVRSLAVFNFGRRGTSRSVSLL